MVLINYLLKRFTKYLFLLNISFTLLFNFIEFFEKTMRVKHATVKTILHFIALNIPPSFFQTLPISCWLATCLLLKELAQHDELQTFKILNINNTKIMHFFLGAGIFLAIFSFIAKEQIVIKLENKSEKFKLEQLKQNSQQKIINKWIVISLSEKAEDENSTNRDSTNQDSVNKNLFCYFDFLDLKTETGSNIILIYLTSNFEIEKIITSDSFSSDSKNQILKLIHPKTLYSDSNTETNNKDKSIKIESFFSQIQLENGIPSISLLAKSLITSKNVIPKDIWNELFYQLIKRILFHLQNLIYPILTFYLFILFPHHLYYKWILIFMPYPIMIIINLLSDSLIPKHLNPLFAFLPYLLIIFLILIHQKKLEKSF